MIADRPLIKEAVPGKRVGIPATTGWSVDPNGSSTLYALGMCCSISWSRWVDKSKDVEGHLEGLGVLEVCFWINVLGFLDMHSFCWSDFFFSCNNDLKVLCKVDAGFRTTGSWLYSWPLRASEKKRNRLEQVAACCAWQKLAPVGAMPPSGNA